MEDTISRSKVTSLLAKEAYKQMIGRAVARTEFLTKVIAEVKNLPSLDVVTVEHSETSTIIHVKNVDEFKTRIILDEGERTRNCAVYYQDSDETEDRRIHCTGEKD